jgi:hypothetical protein
MECPFGAVSLAPGVAALVLSLLRAFELGISARLAVGPFAQALAGLLDQADWERASTLCQSLQPAWPARLASGALAARAHGEDVAFTVDVTGAELRTRAQRHVDAIRTLGRIAIPLALGCAIVELGLGFQPGGTDTIQRAVVQRSLDCALRAGVNGVATALFCQWSVAGLVRQAHARIDELRVVADVLTRGIIRTTR